MRMKNELRAAGGAAMAGLLIAGCGSKPVPPPVMAYGVAAREPLVDPRPYGAADTAFGLDVLGAWCRADPQANLVLSPSSLASGLGMAYLGARGGTARAMAGVLHLPAAGGQQLEAGLQARSAALRDLSGPGVTLNASDQVWADPGLVTERSYLNAVATGYNAGVAQAPLLHNPERARQEINQAIATATRGQIPQLLLPGSLNGIGWVLTDALYMHAAWATPFDATLTSPGPVHHRRRAAGHGAVHDRRSVPCGPGGRLDRGLAPVQRRQAGHGGAAAARRRLRLHDACRDSPRHDDVPAGRRPARPSPGASRCRRCPCGDQVSMKPVLTALGMGVAFTPAADFTGLSPQACCIGLVEQAATLGVGEKGTVASAATAVGMEPTAARLLPPQVLFNRPYLMLVTDRATGEPLFLARVADPATR